MTLWGGGDKKADSHGTTKPLQDDAIVTQAVSASTTTATAAAAAPAAAGKVAAEERRGRGVPPPFEDAIADAVESVMACVVNIRVEEEHHGFFGGGKVFVSLGSGFVIGEEGTILTNAHVVASFENKAKVSSTSSFFTSVPILILILYVSVSLSLSLSVFWLAPCHPE